MFDRPLQFGFTVFGNQVSYNQARQLSIFSGQNLNLPNAVLQNLQNYTQSSAGFTSSLSYPLRRSFKRVGITYSFDRSIAAGAQHGVQESVRVHRIPRHFRARTQ